MARTHDTELIDRFEEFYNEWYHDDIVALAEEYPDDSKSLHVDLEKLHEFDAELADGFRTKPQQLKQYAEEALRLYDLPGDVSLGQADIRPFGLPETTPIGSLSSDQRGELVAIRGVVLSATDVTPELTTGAFECQRCGTLTRIPQDTGAGERQDPHECQGCERQGPFKINYDQSEFVDAQEFRLAELPHELPDTVDANEGVVAVEDDLAGEVTPGDHVTVTACVVLEQQQQNTTRFDLSFRGWSVEPVDQSILPHDPPEEFAPDSIEMYIDIAATAEATMDDNPQEEETKAKLITPFLRALGWPIVDGRRVRLEYTDEFSTGELDYALFREGSETPDIIVEAKRLDRPLEGHVEQLGEYLRVHRAEFGLLTNGQSFKLFVNDTDTDIGIAKIAELDRSELNTSSVVAHLRPGDSDAESTEELAASPIGATPDHETIRHVCSLVEELEVEYEGGAPVEVVIERAADEGIADVLVDKALEDLKQKGEVYQPGRNHLRTT
jgi:DNA replicative helicase MCM subunit Mcm2 (Cdc46/Mcm family)